MSKSPLTTARFSIGKDALSWRASSARTTTARLYSQTVLYRQYYRRNAVSVDTGRLGRVGIYQVCE
jgi:hypothetical protein